MAVEAPVKTQHRSEGALRSLLDYSVDGIVLVDERAAILEWNPAQEQITGLTRDEVRGELLFDVFFGLMPTDQRTVPTYASAKHGIHQYLRYGSAPGFDGTVEAEIVRPDGSRRVIEIRYFPIQRNGRFRAASITRDVTERRLLEQAEINMARMKEEFISNISHGLRSPLQGLIGNLELIAEVDNLGSQEVRAAFNRAHASAHRLANLVEDMTAALAFESTVELALEEVDLRKLIVDAVESTRKQAAEKGVPIAFAPEADPPRVQASQPWLLQAVQILIRNAVRMSGVGSPVVVTAAAQNGEVTVRVIDQGPGIPSGEEQAVFAKRAPGLVPGEDEPDARELELYLSRKIIEAQGGTIGVESQLGVGSTFYFSLPAAEFNSQA
jgi:protein-histidine pros-kinase